MAFTIDTSEVTALGAQLAATTPKAQKLTEMVVKKSAKDVERIAKAFVPVDTGALKNSISSAVGAGFGVMHATIGPTMEYAPYVEYGTRRMAQRAFMGPALDRVSPGFVSAMEQVGRLSLG